MFGDTSPTPLDLRFRLFRFPVRVHPLFWLLTALLGDWTLRLGIEYMLLWVGCVFVSILIHELGHAFAARWFGSPCEIILTMFGGLAAYPYPPRSGWRRMVIALAGPAAGFALAGVVFASAAATGWPKGGKFAGLAFDFLFWINVVWNCINLLPVWPLDGGKVCREVLYMAGVRRPDPATHRVSIAVAGLLAVLGAAAFLRQLPPEVYESLPYVPGPFMTLWMILFAVQNYRMLQATRQAYSWEDDDDARPWRRRG